MESDKILSQIKKILRNFDGQKWLRIAYKNSRLDITKEQKAKGKKRAYSITDSHVVPHRSTKMTCTDLTSQFGRDTVRSREYGRRGGKEMSPNIRYMILTAVLRTNSYSPS